MRGVLSVLETAPHHSSFHDEMGGNSLFSFSFRVDTDIRYSLSSFAWRHYFRTDRVAIAVGSRLSASRVC